MQLELHNLRRKIARYQEVLNNTQNYRKIWVEELQQRIMDELNFIIGEVELEGEVEVRSDLDNLEAVVLNLGAVKSGMSQRVNDHLRQDLIKHNGALIYQQLFNGKVMVLIQYPQIEGYGQARQPKTIAIYRPEELQEPYFVRHVEEFIHDITLWEDYDDDEPHQQRIGFQLNFGAAEEDAMK
ncbi:MAG: hypothetical protein D6772_11950 [Bacteroidetes bacterium]|nr:MAG: hypothetical protein D6772_11950 [Bacteroidota bacterium]